MKDKDRILTERDLVPDELALEEMFHRRIRQTSRQSIAAVIICLAAVLQFDVPAWKGIAIVALVAYCLLAAPSSCEPPCC
jgi:hypothetical protein